MHMFTKLAGGRGNTAREGSIWTKINGQKLKKANYVDPGQHSTRTDRGGRGRAGRGNGSTPFLRGNGVDPFPRSACRLDSGQSSSRIGSPPGATIAIGRFTRSG